MRSLIIYKRDDGNIYHCDLDDNTAIGIDIQVFDPAKPDVSRVNCSNEFTVPKTRNNISIFDGIFVPGQVINDNRYECDYFVDNHRLISGIVYLTGSTDDRISMFIYDKHSLLAKLKSQKFSEFEKEFLDNQYYDMSDWPVEKNAPGYTTLGDMENCFPNVNHPQAIGQLQKDIFKETCVSLYNSEVAQSLAEVKANLTKWVNDIDPLANLCTLYNAIISKWTMDFLNYISPTERRTTGTDYRRYGDGVGLVWSDEQASTRLEFAQQTNTNYPTIAAKKKFLMANEAYLIMGIDYNVEGKCDSMYIGGYPIGNRESAIGMTNWHISDDLQTFTLEHNPHLHNLTIPEDNLLQRIEELIARFDAWDYYADNEVKLHYSPFGGYSHILYAFELVNGGSTDYYEDDDWEVGGEVTFARPKLFRLLRMLLEKIKTEAQNQGFILTDGDSISKQDLLANIDFLTAENYTTYRGYLDDIVSLIPVQDDLGYFGAMQADGCSIYNDYFNQVNYNNIIRTESQSVWEEDGINIRYCVCYVGEDVISCAPPISLAMCNAWKPNEDDPYRPSGTYMGKFWTLQRNYIKAIYDAIVQGTTKTARITKQQLQEYNLIQYSDSDKPPLKFIPTSSSEDDVFTVENDGTVSKLTMSMAKLDGSQLQYNSGSLYASSYSILSYISNKYNCKIDRDIEWSRYFTNFPDLVINTSDYYWWWDINQPGEGSKTTSPRNKTMYDWLMMFCKAHSLVPVIDNNWNQTDPISGVTYTSRITFRSYGETGDVDYRSADEIFDLRAGTEWIGDGGYSNSVNYVDFASVEEGLDKHSSDVITISNPSLNDEPNILYTNGIHRMKIAIPNNKVNIWQTKGSEDFQYIYQIGAQAYDPNSSPVDYNIDPSEVKLDFKIGASAYTMKDADNNDAYMYYLPDQTNGQYLLQPATDVSMLKRLVTNPYPVVYEVEVYADLNDLMDAFMASTDMAVYHFKDLGGYYYITKVEGINGYNRKSPVKLTLIRYK